MFNKWIQLITLRLSNKYIRKMKKQLIILFAGISVLMASCISKPEPRTLDDIPSADINDSIAHYWGQMLSNRYWQMAKQDSAMKTADGKESFLEGFQAIMSMVKNDDNAFNMGMYSAIDAMLGMVQANKDFMIDVDRTTMLSAIAWGMQSDTIVDIAKADAMMRTITMRLQREKEARERVVADSIIAEKIKADGYERDLKSNVYKEITKGNGSKVESNDQILADISFSKIDGTPLFPSTGASKFVVDQNQFPSIVNEMIKEMNIGSTRQFLAVAADVFGGNIPRHLGIKSSDVVVFMVKVVGYCDDNGNPSDVAIKAKPLDDKKQIPMQPKPVRK